MDAKKISIMIEQSNEFTIFNPKNPSSDVISSQKDQESMNAIYFLQSELNETKANYQQLFKDFQLYRQKTEEILQKQSQYLLKEQQLQSDLKDQIKSLQSNNDQLAQRNKEILAINNERNAQLLEQLQNSQQQLEKLQAERDYLLDSNKKSQDQIEQWMNKYQLEEVQNQELKQTVQNLEEALEESKKEKQTVQNLEEALEKRQKENNILLQQMKNEKEQEIKYHLESIAKKIVEKLNTINNQSKNYEQQKVQRKSLAYDLLQIFNQNLRQPLKTYDLTFRHEFIDNRINGFEDIEKKKSY